MILSIRGDKKNIPKRYVEIENIEDYIDDLHCSRLSETERHNLNTQLMKFKMAEAIAEINKIPSIRELIQTSEPAKALRIKTRNDTYYVLRFANGNEVRCMPSQFKACPVKETINRLY